MDPHLRTIGTEMLFLRFENAAYHDDRQSFPAPLDLSVAHIPTQHGRSTDPRSLRRENNFAAHALAGGIRRVSQGRERRRRLSALVYSHARLNRAIQESE
eukprot:3160016-Rhodomonas_salina.3